MTDRTTETAVTFRHAFTIAAFDAPHPAGTYRVVVDEAAIEGLSFLAWHRVATALHTPALGQASGASEVFATSAEELARALAADDRP